MNLRRLGVIATTLGLATTAAVAVAPARYARVLQRRTAELTGA